MTLPSNLIVVRNATDFLRGVEGRFHATNGTYMYPTKKVVPTTLAGFQFIADCIARPTDDFLIAVNSDKSMYDFSPELTTQSQEERALKVALPLANQHPDRTVFVTYYDEETPNNLYDGMAASSDIEAASLHKWGYGLEKKGRIIEGAENFEQVFAFPFFDKKIKPVFFDVTRVADQEGNVKVVDLYNTAGTNGDVYLGPRNGLKFKRK